MSKQSRVIFAITLIIMLAFVTSTLILLYWMAGGQFERSPALAVLCVGGVYVWVMVIKIAIDKAREEKQVACRVCGYHPHSRMAQQFEE